MELITIIYIGCMSALGIIVCNMNCKKYDKNIINKKRFKHYRTHLYNVRY
jgi:hypothetical protein